jgi:hypothetical protein
MFNSNSTGIDPICSASKRSILAISKKPIEFTCGTTSDKNNAAIWELFYRIIQSNTDDSIIFSEFSQESCSEFPIS